MLDERMGGGRRHLGLRSVAPKVVTLALAGTLVAGCGIFGGDGDGGGSTSDGGPAPKVELASDNHAKGAVARASQLYRGYDITVDVLSLKKFDKALRLTYVIIPRAKGSTEDLSKDTFGGSALDGHAGAPFLMDTDRMRAYGNLQIGSGDDAKCACSTVEDDFPLDQPTVLYVDFPAPEDSPKSMTVVFPVVGPVPGVKVS